MAETLTLTEFNERLSRHDWFFDYSDDAAVWRRGSEASGQLTAIGLQSPEHQSLLDAWKDHKYRNGPKPVVPSFGKKKGKIKVFR